MDPSEGPGDPASSLFLAPDEAQKAEKNFFLRPSPPPLSEGMDPPQLLLLIYLSTF